MTDTCLSVIVTADDFGHVRAVMPRITSDCAYLSIPRAHTGDLWRLILNGAPTDHWWSGSASFGVFAIADDDELVMESMTGADPGRPVEVVLWLPLPGGPVIKAHRLDEPLPADRLAGSVVTV